MSRARFLPSRRTLLLAVLLATLFVRVWCWVGPPSEPVYEGWPLSRWVHGPFDDAHFHSRYGALQVMAGPGVKWAINRLKYGGLGERRAAAGALAAFGPDSVAAIPALARAMDTDDSELSLICARALNRCGPPSRTVVRDKIAHGSSLARACLIWWLGERVPDSSQIAFEDEWDWLLEVIRQAFHDSEPEVRLAAVYAFGVLLQKPGSEPPLRSLMPSFIRLLGDPNRRVTATVSETFRRRGYEGNTPLSNLVGLLRDRQPANRIAATETLAIFLERQSAARLLDLTHHPDPECRAAALRALRARGIAAPE